jgi:hypothetical protein
MTCAEHATAGHSCFKAATRELALEQPDLVEAVYRAFCEAKDKSCHG